ncbi:MAG: HAMP domain-containing histidine kinase [Acidobacteria bacterium]|nr:HAMP domain-containing histidine kinase [Acidobacteriota bacterium]
MAADFLPHVFDRFRQADPSATRGTWGLGIGLSIARHLAELHGGSIDAASDGLGKGATFVLQLPKSAPAADTGTQTGTEACLSAVAAQEALSAAADDDGG